MLDKDIIIKRAKNAILDADEKAALDLIYEVIDSDDKTLLPVLNEGFASGNNILGEQFDKGFISIVELIYSSEVMKKALEEIMRVLNLSGTSSKGKIMIATVEGDVHDIGKGIVASTLKIAGYDVIDLGREVSSEMIIDAAQKYDADIIGTSALLTSTLTEQKKLEKLLRERGLKDKFKTMVGGAPCTKRWAKKIGADAYSSNAIDAVEAASRLLKE